MIRSKKIIGKTCKIKIYNNNKLLSPFYDVQKTYELKFQSISIKFVPTKYCVDFGRSFPPKIVDELKPEACSVTQTASGDLRAILLANFPDEAERRASLPKV